MTYTCDSLLLPDGYRQNFFCWDGQAQDCLLYLHGIESHAAWFTQSASAVNDLGWPVMLVERRGSGRNSQDRGHAQCYRQLLSDVFCAARYCHHRWPGYRINLAGVSWGGKLALAAALKYPDLFASLTMITPGLFPLVDLPLAHKLAVLFKHLITPRATLPVPIEEASLFTDNPQRISFIQQDPLRLHQVSLAFFWASYCLDKFIKAKARTIPVPVHLILSGADQIIDSAITRQWFHSCPAPHRHLSEFPDSAHTLEFASDNSQFLKAFTGYLKARSQGKPKI